MTGETATTWRGLWLWAAAVIVPAVVGGWSFPVAAAALGGPTSAATAYALESGGAMAGGLVFTFLLAQQGSVVALCTAAGVTLAASLATHGRPWLAVLPLAVAAAAAVPGDRALASAGWRWSGRAGRLTAWQETRQQRLEFSTGPPAALYADGRLLASYPDPYRAAPRAHLALLLHKNPRRVLLLGGTADGTVPAMLREPEVRLTVVEEDHALARMVPEWFGASLAEAFADPRVTLVGSDPLRAVGRDGPWDEIVLLDGDPTTLRHNRTRTVEFFRACAGALGSDGVLVVRVGVGDTYLGGAGGRLLAVTAATLREAFPQVIAVPGEEVLLAAGREAAGISADPAVLAERWRRRGAVDPEFGLEMIPLLADPGRAAGLAGFLADHRAPVNRAQHPRAVVLAAALHEARGSPPLLATARALEAGSTVPLLVCLAVVVAVVLARGASGASLGVEAAAVVGFASMAWWLLLLAGWQATRGSVYAEVGALSAAFMAGLVVGSSAARRWSFAGPGFLAAVLTAGAGVSLADRGRGSARVSPRHDRAAPVGGRLAHRRGVPGGGVVGGEGRDPSRRRPGLCGRRGGSRNRGAGGGPAGPPVGGNDRGGSGDCGCAGRHGGRDRALRTSAAKLGCGVEGTMDAERKRERYRRVVEQLRELFVSTPDPIARMATAAALLHAKMGGFFWTGWYLLKDGELTVGPYQGSLACLVLPAHQGVCWAGIDRGEAVIVPDVHAFPGHVACDSRSRSEIVIPVRDGSGTVAGVLDVDSERPAHFDEADREGLETVAALIYS